jgi:hypothetical protein
MNSGDEFPYREGYRRGARQLVEYVCSESRDQDFLVYPIIYLYRHHVELALKRLLPLTADLAGENLSEKCLRDLDQHRIDELWNNLKHFLKTEKIRKHCGVAIAAEDFAGLNSYIQQLSKIDPDAQAFRYSHLKTGEASLPETLTHVNLAVFGDHMESLCNYLDCIDTQLDRMQELRDEMETYYAERVSEYRDVVDG